MLSGVADRPRTGQQAAQGARLASAAPPTALLLPHALHIRAEVAVQGLHVKSSGSKHRGDGGSTDGRAMTSSTPGRAAAMRCCYTGARLSIQACALGRGGAGAAMPWEASLGSSCQLTHPKSPGSRR